MKQRKVAVIGVIGVQAPAEDLRIPSGIEEWEITPSADGLLDLMPESLRQIADRIGRGRARIVWRLMRRGIQGSVPELLTYNWLERRRRSFWHQSAQLGGRMAPGGAVVDFIIFDLAPGAVYVWRVMGEYWHSSPEIQRKDEAQKARLKRQQIGGREVVAVVDLWESDIYERSPEIFELAEAGVGLRG